MAEKRVSVALEKLAQEMGTQKAACHKALDERERMVDLMKHLQEDSSRDENDFLNQVETLKRDSEDLDNTNRQAESVLEAATELAKRQQCASMRQSRTHKEKLEVRYGYLRSQLEGVDNDFRELQRIVGVHFQPSHPESLEQIIKKFVEKEGQVVSLQRYFSLQSDEIETLTSQLAHLTRESEAAAADKAVEDAAYAAAAGSGSRRAPWNDGGATVEGLSKRFDQTCSLLEALFLHAGCDTDPAGMHLATKGCSSSTIHDFLSCLAARIDGLNVTSHSLREASAGHRNASARKSNDTLDSFLRPRTVGFAAEASTAGSVDGVDALLGEVKRSFNKDDLPSMSDHGPEAEGDAEPAESRRRRERDAKKGAIDREKRDSAISAWVQRQNQVRGAQTHRPDIREFYDAKDDPKWPPRAVYPPASVR